MSWILLFQTLDSRELVSRESGSIQPVDVQYSAVGTFLDGVRPLDAAVKWIGIQDRIHCIVTRFRTFFLGGTPETDR